MSQEAIIVERLVNKLKGQVGEDIAKVLAEAVNAGVSQLSFKSLPPSGYHKVYNIYAQKVNGVYQPILEVESEPQP